ncbi:gluconokinase [Algoriphagus limi]|uniref:Gluconokinase n=1 Tax=Algoriphagus limi TaxID=2975273 RepID=A0ABT2G8M6_9BACT|nr:gluconokinase [Algoriphagus limi]MCS5490360.1 gluconokinase [Algoriphagus limi]
MKKYKLIIITGVSGTGKTTLGTALSEKLGIPFYDADHFHPIENIAKMSAGIPLNDEDRKPWLQSLANKLEESKTSGGCVLACSALKESYRKILSIDPSIHWIHLKGDRDLIWERMKARKNHYMKAEMLDSQFATWEEPDYGHKLSIAQSPEAMLEEALDFLKK